MNDTQLLQSFVEGSENAFRTLVERHLPLVLGTARRLTNNSGLAEDIAQTVFILLAQKAKGLSSATILPGWLYRTTCFVARRALCSEHRRQRREQEAAHMHEANQTDPAWEQISPDLDHALARLNDSDRNALLLRFFNGKPLRDVGISLGITEEAAKKRVGRALEKLRGALQRRGKEVSVATLISGLTHEGAQATSGELSSQIAATATATCSGALAGSALLTEVVAALHWLKVKTALFTAAAAGLALLLVSTFIWKSEPVTAKPGPNTVGNKLAHLKQSRRNTNDGVTYSGTGADGSEQLNVKKLRVVVLDSASSAPLSGVKVIHDLMQRSEAKPATPILTGKEGTVDIEIPQNPSLGARMNQFQVWVTAENFAPREIHWLCTTGNVLSTVSTNYTIRLSRGIELAAKVVNEEGQPIEGVKVKVHGSNYRGFTTSSTNGKVTSPPEVRAEDFAFYSRNQIVTDGAGGFVLPDYPADLPKLLIELTTPGGALVKFRTPQGKRLSADETFDVSFQDLKNGTASLMIPKGVTVEGMVVDAGGQPVKGAKVVEATQWGNLKVHSETITDTAGRFSLPDRPAREYIVTASADGHGSASVIAAAEPGMKPVQIQLPREQPLRGKIVDATGSPQSDVGVNLVDIYNRGLGFVWSATTDADGRFAWRAAPTNEVTLSISGAGNFRIVRLKPSTNEQVIQLFAPNAKVRVTGKVIDADTKAPVPQFRVGMMLGWDNTRESPTKTIDGMEGTFEAELEYSEFPIGKLDAWSLQVDAEGYETATTRAYQWGEGNQEMTIELAKGGPVTGTIWTPDGEPAASCQVALAKFAHSVFSPQQGNLQPNARPADRADNRGRFKLERELEMTNIVAFHKSGWTAVGIPKSRKEMKIQLQPWSRIEGTVVLNGIPQAGEKVQLQNLIFDIANPIMISHQATADKEGRFVFAQVPAGNYELSLASTNIREVNRPSISTLQTAVTVGPGETKSVTVGSSGVSVVGRLHMPQELASASWSNAIAILSLDVPLPKDPPRSMFVREESHRAARVAFARDPRVIAQLGGARNYSGRISEDGSVVFQHVPGGRYFLEVSLFAKADPAKPYYGNPEEIAQTKVAISVPEQPIVDGETSIVSFEDLTLDPF